MGAPVEHKPYEESDLDAVLRASRVFVAVVAQSIAEVEDVVTPPQWRVLVLIATRGPQTLGAVAADLGVHPSNATRTGDRLEAAGLVCREGDPVDRRSLRLRLTGEGRSLVERVMSHRRHALNDVMERMKPDDRRMLETALSAFAEAAGEMPDEAMSAALGLG
jgi:DNA-binding MarR family transcriptional regulator